MALKQKFSGDFSQLIKEHEKLLAAQVRQERQMRDLKTTAVTTGNKQVSALRKLETANSRAITGVKNMAASYISIQEALSGINDELQRREKLELAARDASVRLADAEHDVIINMGKAPAEVKRRFLNEVGEISVDAGFQSKAPVFEASSKTFTAVGGNIDVTLDVMRAMTPLFKSKPNELAPAAEAVGDLVSLTNFSGRETAGMLFSTMEKARIKSLDDFINFAPAVAAGVNTQQNIDPKRAATESMALLATLGQSIKDGSGQRTRTAFAALTTALERNFEIDQAKFEKLTNSGVAIEDARKQSALSIAERVDFAQNLNERIADAENAGLKPAKADLAIRDDLLKTGFEIDIKPVVRQFLAGNDTAIASRFDAILPEVTPDAKLLDQMIEQLDSLTTNRAIATASRKTEGVIEGAQTQGEAATDGAIREQLTKGLDSTGLQVFGAGIDSAFRKAAFSISNDKAHSALIQLREREVDIRKGGFFGEVRSDEQLSPVESGEIRIIRQAADSIAELEKRRQNSQTTEEFRAANPQLDLRDVKGPVTRIGNAMNKALEETERSSTSASTKWLKGYFRNRRDFGDIEGSRERAVSLLNRRRASIKNDNRGSLGPEQLEDLDRIEQARRSINSVAENALAEQLRINSQRLAENTAATQAAAASQPTPPPTTPPVENAVPAPTTGNAAAQSRVHDERD